MRFQRLQDSSTAVAFFMCCQGQYSGDYICRRENSDKSTVIVVFDHFILKSGFTKILQDMDEIPVNEADSYEAKAFAAFGTFEELGDKELQVRL